jgi:hypothetical protein
VQPEDPFATFPSFRPLFATSERAGASGYLKLLNLTDGAREAIDQIRTAIARSVDRVDAEIAALLGESNWRPQLVGAVAVLVAGANAARLTALWSAIDRPCWTSPQLVATASLVDGNFDAQARSRLDRTLELDARAALSMPWPERHSALGPGSVEAHSAKVLAALLGICERRPSCTWLGPYLVDERLRQTLAKDTDNGRGIAVRWAEGVAGLLAAANT